MGLLGNFFYKVQRGQIFAIADTVCKRMSETYNVLTQANLQHGDKTAFIETAISRLPTWEEAGEHTFRHKKGGTIEIEQDDDLIKVIRKIVEKEVYHMTTGQPIMQCVEIQQEAQNEITDYFNKLN